MFVSKSKHDAVLLEKKTLEEMHARQDQIIISTREKLEGTLTRLQDALEEIEELKNKLTTVVCDYESKIDNIKKELERERSKVVDDSSYVKILVSEDLRNIIPHIAYTKKMPDRLFQEGILSDSNIDNPAAIQLALLTLVFESLEQMLEAFSEEPNNE